MSIKLRVTLVVVVLLSCVSATFAAREIQIFQQRQAQANEQLFEDIENHFYQALDGQLNLIALTVETIAQTPDTQQAFANLDRTFLIGRYEVYFQDLRDRYGIDQFQFHLPDGVSFLRLHQTHKYGDDLSAFRQTVVMANRTRRVVKGLEVGRAGPGLRVVVPVLYQGKHIGTVEFGGGIEALLASLEATFEIDYAVGIKQSVFDQARRLEPLETDLTLGDTVFYAFSDTTTRQLLVPLTQAGSLPVKGMTVGQYRYLYPIELVDFSGDAVGTLLIILDRSEEAALLTREIHRVLLISITVLILAIAILLGLLHQALAPIQTITALTQQVAQGNFRLTVGQTRQDEMGSIQRGLVQILQHLDPVIRNVKLSAAEMEQASDRLIQAAQQLAGGVAHQATNAAAITASLAEISTAISQNTAHSAQTATISERASAEIAAVNQAVVNTTTAIRQIATKISVIDEIAYTTHLLSINAAIEASAAGDQGQGFAVLAVDIRKLSEQVRATANEIVHLVQSSAVVANESHRRLAQLVPTLSESNRLTGEVYAASQQQDHEVAQIAQAMTQLEQVMQRNSAHSEALIALADHFVNQAMGLQTTVNFFQIDEA